MIKKGSRHSQWNGAGEISGNWWYNHVLRERNQKVRQRIPVNVSVGEAWDLFLKQDKKCALSGLPLTISGASRYNTASVDRIDSSRGYELDNIQWVHKDINFMKRTYSQDYFIGMCKMVSEKEERLDTYKGKKVDTAYVRKELGLCQFCDKDVSQYGVFCNKHQPIAEPARK
jgi:hypothetical protein